MHGKLESIFDKIIGAISTWLVAIAAVAIVFWIFVMVVFIAARALFNTYWMFVEEFSSYLMVLAGFFPLSYTLRTKGHISVDALTRLLPKSIRDVLTVITTSLSLVVVCYLTQKAALWFLYGLESNVHSQFPSNVPLWPVYLLVPMGLASLGFALLLQLYGNIQSLAERHGNTSSSQNAPGNDSSPDS